MTTSMTVKEWQEEDQPREKLINLGSRALSSAELLAILLRTGCEGLNVVDLAKQLLASANGSLHQLSLRSVGELSHTKGIGQAKAVTLCAAMEIGHRLMAERANNRTRKVTKSTDLYEEFVSEIGNLDHEEFWAIYMNTQLQVLHKCRITSGGISETTVDIRLILKTALSFDAVNVAVAHNHPSGVITPSTKDNDLTKRIATACHTVQIQLIDHIIVGATAGYVGEGDSRTSAGTLGEHYYSYRDMGLL